MQRQEIQAVVAIYHIDYAALVITAARLGDIAGRKRAFLACVIGFTVASLWCGLSESIHMPFTDTARARALAVFCVTIGLGAAVGFMLGGWLVTLNLARLGSRSIFCVNVLIGLANRTRRRMADASTAAQC